MIHTFKQKNDKLMNAKVQFKKKLLIWITYLGFRNKLLDNHHL